MSIDHSLRFAHEDNRNEAARAVRATVRLEEVRRLAYELAARRIEPLLATSSRPSDDWSGCVE